MPKSVKSEELKLVIDIPVSEGKEYTNKSTPSSPRITRAAANLAIMSDLDLNLLFKFIKPYDGNRTTLNSFLINCQNAYDLASEGQKSILFKYIISQLQGKAEIACSIKEFNNWEQLKDFLKSQFCEQKHYTYLLTDLQESKQNTNETVNQYALRVESCLSQLLTEISLTTTKAKELPGRIATIEDLALHHFLMGLNPRISTIVRCKSPKSLNDAINFANAEEKLLQVTSKRSASSFNQNNPIRATQPQRQFQPVNKAYNNQRGTFTPPHPNYQNFSPPTRPDYHRFPPPTNNPDVCRYCKLPGHTIDVCRTRENNNNRRFGTQQMPNQNQRPPYRPINNTYLIEEESRDEVDGNLNSDTLPTGIVREE